LKFESVTGKASIYVKQDFLALTLAYDIIQDLIAKAQSVVDERAKLRNFKYNVRMNENIAIGLFKEQFIRLMPEKDNELKSTTYQKLIADMERNIVRIRQSKGSKRKWNFSNKYKCNLKPSF
jgi:hypothetical protein